MAKTAKQKALSDNHKRRLTNEMAGILDYMPELKEYAKQNPNDKWAQGQLKYFARRLDELQEQIENA